MKNNSMNLLRIASLSLATFAFAAGPALAQSTPTSGTSAQQAAHSQDQAAQQGTGAYGRKSNTANQSATSDTYNNHEATTSPNQQSTNGKWTKHNNSQSGA